LLVQPFTPRKQALHDLLAGAVVLTRRPAGAAVVETA
jgi:uncharacterized RDD family membrane protein YckC